MYKCLFPNQLSLQRVTFLGRKLTAFILLPTEEKYLIIETRVEVVTEWFSVWELISQLKTEIVLKVFLVYPKF